MESQQQLFSIAIIYSLPSNTRVESGFLEAEEDTVISVKALEQALQRPGVTITLYPIRPEDIPTIKNIKADLIFNYLEWTGVDLPYAIQAWTVLESMAIPFTGATKDNYYLTTDKLLMKKALVDANVMTPQFIGVADVLPTTPLPFPFPAIVKLAWEHGGVGLGEHSVVKNQKELERTIQYLWRTFPNQPIILEEFIEGREFEVGLIETNDGLVILPPSENVYAPTSKGVILTFEGRWAANPRDYVDCVTELAHLDDIELSSIESICKVTYQKLSFRDYARFDLRMNKDGVIYIIEANSNPGLDDNMTTSLPQGFHAYGMSFTDFLWKIIQTTLKRAGKKELLQLVT